MIAAGAAKHTRGRKVKDPGSPLRPQFCSRMVDIDIDCAPLVSRIALYGIKVPPVKHPEFLVHGGSGSNFTQVFRTAFEWAGRGSHKPPHEVLMKDAIEKHYGAVEMVFLHGRPNAENPTRTRGLEWITRPEMTKRKEIRSRVKEWLKKRAKSAHPFVFCSAEYYIETNTAGVSVAAHPMLFSLTLNRTPQSQRIYCVDLADLGIAVHQPLKHVLVDKRIDLETGEVITLDPPREEVLSDQGLFFNDPHKHMILEVHP